MAFMIYTPMRTREKVMQPVFTAMNYLINLSQKNFGWDANCVPNGVIHYALVYQDKRKDISVNYVFKIIIV